MRNIEIFHSNQIFISHWLREKYQTEFYHYMDDGYKKLFGLV